MSLVEAAGRSRPIAHGESLILMDWILPLAGKSIRLLVMIRLPCDDKTYFTSGARADENCDFPLLDYKRTLESK